MPFDFDPPHRRGRTGAVRTALASMAALAMLMAAAPARAVDAAPAAAAATASAETPPPTYRTRMPPGTTLNYVMRKGSYSGTGELVWRPTGSSYEAKLQGRVAGMTIMTWVSKGSLDNTGIVPVRYTDERLARAVQVADFQRDAGKITYSGPKRGEDQKLVPGAQDRLTWMIQVAAIAQADPRLLNPGGRIAMFVTGARGDAEVWNFTVQGKEDVVVGGTALKTIKLMREPRKPNDTQVEVWLEPTRNYLPVKARLSKEGDALDLQLASAAAAS
jgi:hypothetical protein